MWKIPPFARSELLRQNEVLRSHGIEMPCRDRKGRSEGAATNRGDLHLFIGYEAAEGTARSYVFLNLSQDTDARWGDHYTLMLWRFIDNKSWWLEESDTCVLRSHGEKSSRLQTSMIQHAAHSLRSPIDLSGSKISDDEGNGLLDAFSIYFLTGTFPSAPTPA